MWRKTRTEKKEMMEIWQVLFFILTYFCGSISCQLQYSIPEEMKQGSVLGNIAKDLQLIAKELSSRKFHIVSRGKKQYFSVNLSNGDFLIAERIDREMLCGLKQNCFLSLETVIENPLNLYTVKVEIEDINDNPPVFSNDAFKIMISESSLPGARFALGHAQDPDLGLNAVQGYKLSANGYFKLGEKSGTDGIKYPELVLEQSLDREKISFQELILTAFDGGKPYKTGTALIKVLVHDANDNYPIFNKDIYRVSINENVPKGFIVLNVNATDEDEGSNAHITYSFSNIPENARKVFNIDPLRGTIETLGQLNYEDIETYQMTVEAKDGGGLVAHCKVLIDIIDINDNAPEIIITSLLDTIKEDSSSATVIALINIEDLDFGENSEVISQITEDLPFQLLSSSSNYYKLVTSSKLDREIKSVYNITIKAVDKGSPQLSTIKTIRLFVSDVNDNPPVFGRTRYPVYITENNQLGASINSVHASDLDDKENGNILYSIVSTTTEDLLSSSYVSINSMTGVIYAQRSFDYEQLREFQFQVMAKDSGSPPLSSNVTVRICIIDKNDNAPKILYPSPDTEGSALFEFIPHSAEKGYLVTKVIAVDADSGHNAWLSYHLVPEPSLVTIGQYSGEIRIARDFQYTDTIRPRIVIMVKDNGSPSLSSTITLNLVVAENFQQVLPEIRHQSRGSDASFNVTFYLVIAIALLSILFIVTVILILSVRFCF
ncbi:protocadherin gamma-B5-like [Mixophyes fleayi]|uniref:protocadherin gamma-B5-like n=1 Tax=Mixophyes fleayi TaxID=3061075 RepID=UPI003F4DC856